MGAKTLLDYKIWYMVKGNIRILSYRHILSKWERQRFDSIWGLRIFSLYHARDKTKNIFLENGYTTNFTVEGKLIHEERS